MPEPSLTRRTVLGAVVLTVLGGAGALAACTSEQPDTASGPSPTPPPSPSPTPAPEPAPDEAIIRRAVDGKLALLRDYAAVLTAHPRLAARLAPLVAHHRAHVEALAPHLSTTATPGNGPPARGTPAQAVALLARRERRLARQRLADVVPASPSLARLLASIGAAEAVHAVLLDPA